MRSAASKIIPLLACMLVGGMIGFGIGRWSGFGTTSALLAENTNSPESGKRGAKVNMGNNATVASSFGPVVFGKTEWGALPLRARLEKCLAMNDKWQRFGHFSALLSGLESNEDFDLVSRLIKEGDRSGRGFGPEYEFLLQQWGRKQGEGCIETLKRGVEKDVKDNSWYVARVLYGWAETNPTEAVAWLNAHQEIPNWDSVLVDTLIGTAKGSLQLGTDAALANLEPGANRVRDEVMKNLAEIAVYNGGTSGLDEWFKSLPASAAGQSARQGAFYQVYHHMMHASREEASQFLKENAAGPWRSDRGYQEYVSALAKESPQTAMDWLQELPQGEGQPSWPGALEVIANWKQSDPGALEEWGRNLPDSPFGKLVRSRLK